MTKIMVTKKIWKNQQYPYSTCRPKHQEKTKTYEKQQPHNRKKNGEKSCISTKPKLWQKNTIKGCKRVKGDISSNNYTCLLIYVVRQNFKKSKIRKKRNIFSQQSTDRIKHMHVIYTSPHKTQELIQNCPKFRRK